jgi:hypothetical protein
MVSRAGNSHSPFDEAVGRAGVVAFRWRSGVRSMPRVGDLFSPQVVGVEEFTGVAGVVRL